MENYDYYKKIWESPKQYALVKNGFGDEYAIIDILNKLFVLIEDESVEAVVQKNLKENGCKVFANIREAYNVEGNN